MRMECTEEEEEDHIGMIMYENIIFNRERERESQYITLWCTWMMHMITYTNVLTPLHSSHPTHIPVPEGSVELISTLKHCG